MIRRNTWIVLAIFLVLLAGAILWNRSEGGKTASSTPTTAPQPLFGIRPDAVQSLQVQSAAGERLVMDRDVSGQWALTEPQAEGTDAAQADAAVSAFTDLEIETTLGQPPALDALGLAPAPAYTVTLGTANGGAQSVKVGKETPTGSGYYVLTAGGTIVVVGKFPLEGALDVLQNPPASATPTAAAGTASPTATP